MHRCSYRFRALKHFEPNFFSQRGKIAQLAADRDKADDQMTKWLHDMAGRHLDQLEASKAILDEKVSASRRPQSRSLQYPAEASNTMSVLLHEKDAEIRQLGVWLAEAQAKASSVDAVREELQEQFRAQLSRRLRQYENMGQEIEDLKQEVRWREEEVSQINARLNQVRQIAAVALKMDIGGGYFNRELAAELLEAKIHGIEGLRSLIDTDMAIYARDQRIGQLSRSLEELRKRASEEERETALDLLRKTEAAQAELRQRDARIEELSVRLYMMTETAMRLGGHQ